MRSFDLYEINSFLGPTSGRGGHGGSAIELIASNDITIGTYGKIVMKGGNGEQTSEGGGGGGSGGAILISSGTTILIDGVLDVSGGDGGFGAPRNTAPIVPIVVRFAGAAVTAIKAT